MLLLIPFRDHALSSDALAEWLRRRPAKPLGFARTGSNPVGVVVFCHNQCLIVQMLPDIVDSILRIVLILSILGLVGYDARLTRERSRVQSSEDVLLWQ